MSEVRIGQGVAISTAVDLPLGSTTDQLVVPAGTPGKVTRAYTDALGGYQVALEVDGKTVSAVLYANQLTALNAQEPTEAPGKGKPKQPEMAQAAPETP